MKRRLSNVLTFVSLVLLVTTVLAGVRSFFVENGIQWCPGVRQVNAGEIRARIVRYEVALSRGLVGFYRTRDDFLSADVGTRAGWFSYSYKPNNLIIDPLPQDRVNVRFAGFQLYYGLFTNQVGGLNVHAVHILVLPLWPMLLCAVPPWLWWRRRRREVRRRGFPLAARDRRRCDAD